MELSLYRELLRYEKWLKSRVVVGSNIDYSYKALCIGNKLDSAINKISYSQHLNNLNECFGVVSSFAYDKHTLDYWLNDLQVKFGVCGIIEGYRIANARYHRVSRLKKRIEKIIEKDSLFITLTFTDEVLSKTSSKTRREYATRFLKKYSSDYVGNIDFGSRNHREHYHAVIQAERLDHNSWSYGAISFEKIYNKDSVKLSQYVAKLTNHAIKETTKRSSLLYPKKIS